MNIQEFVASLSTEQNAALLAFRAGIVAQHDQSMQEFRVLHDAAVAEKNAAVEAMQALTADRDSLQSQVATLTADKQNLTDQIAAVTGNYESQIQSLNAELDALKNPPFDKRALPPYSFLQRFTIDERIAILLAAKDDPMVGLIMAELQTVRRVSLDIKATQDAVGYLTRINILTPERATALLADATAEEQ